MYKWKANKLPIIGCSECIGDTSVRGKKCTHCMGYGFFPIQRNKIISTGTINQQITKGIKYGNTN